MRDPREGPRPALSVGDVMALVVGIVVGAGIFKTPSLVAQNVAGPGQALGAWLLGGLVSLIGALCYAELAAAHPHAGGEYHYLSRAYGPGVGLLFAWARLSVVQTGSIAMQAFLVGDYASRVWSLGPLSSSLYAGLTIGALTALNLVGLRQGRRAQNLLSSAIVVGLLGIVVVVLLGAVGILPAPPPAAASTTTEGGTGAFGLAMIFVLLTYGGWNEAVYLSTETRDGPRAIKRALLGGLALVCAIYLVFNAVLLHALGHARVAASSAVVADLMALSLGPAGAHVVSVVVVVAALSTMNATIITGARSAYALGRDLPRLRLLARWRTEAGVPSGALLVQGAVALALVLLGALTRTGFATMVEYTAPVFWLFFLLVGAALFVLRWREPALPRPFRVPLYPATPIAFCAVAAYMLVASVRHTGIGALVGIAVLLAGAPLLWLLRRDRAAALGGGVPKRTATD